VVNWRAARFKIRNPGYSEGRDRTELFERQHVTSGQHRFGKPPQRSQLAACLAGALCATGLTRRCLGSDNFAFAGAQGEALQMPSTPSSF
jgi:hypothetical protein